MKTTKRALPLITALLLAPLAGLLAAGWPLQRRGGVSSTHPFFETCQITTD
jgi:hypothetical protein